MVASLINFTKSTLYFSPNTPEDLQSLYVETFQMQVTEAIEKYLGLPMLIGRSPSYIWKSIIWGRELLLKGLRKKVGTGDTILVFKDPWLPRPFSFKPTSFNHSHSNLLVKELMAETRIGWNVDLLRVLFNEADQQCIGSIPLCKFPKEDSWMWHYTVDGSYSIKSGYYVASQFNLSATSPSKDKFSIWWKKNLEAPFTKQSVKLGFHEILPTSKGLQKRSILPHSNCLTCGFSNESNGHAVFWCRGFRKVWKLLNFSFLKNFSLETSFQQTILLASEVLSQVEFELFLVVAWYVWSERTQIVHGQEQFSPTVVVSRIHKLHAEFSASRKNINIQRGNTCTSTSSIGAIIRNNTGGVVACLLKSLF
ncbi:hypothetical protein G4B88_002662, partial [Cannabis sativa]